MNNLIAYILYSAILMLHMVIAQRPSFAGSRPVNGLNQKDKYNIPQNSVGANSFANRFGGAAQVESITIAYGAPQRPPTGVELVHPENQFVPLATGTKSQFSTDQRLGGGDTLSTVTVNNVTSMNANLQNVNPNRLPLDAHGDQALIDQLSRLPVELQPFWFVNYQAIEAHRNSTNPNVGALETRGSFFAG